MALVSISNIQDFMIPGMQTDLKTEDGRKRNQQGFIPGHLPGCDQGRTKPLGENSRDSALPTSDNPYSLRRRR